MKLSWRSRALRGWRQEIRPLLVFVLVLFAFRSAVADWYDVPTGSMKPSILEGDRVFVHKSAYDLKVPFTTWRLWTWDAPARGDVVVFLSPADGQRLVKRVVGLPGDTVELRDNRLWINGEAVPCYADAELDPAWSPGTNQVFSETLATRTHPVQFLPGRPARPEFGPATVPAGHYFVLGDNRDNSLDSRYFGFVPRQRILGEAVGVAMSFAPAGRWHPRWNRFFTPLP